MKFYSETLKQLFNTQEECAKAETAHNKAIEEAEAKKKALTEQRAERAKEVEELYKIAVEAKQNYDQTLKKFLEDYGSFHATFKTTDPFFGIFDWF